MKPATRVPRAHLWRAVSGVAVAALDGAIVPITKAVEILQRHGERVVLVGHDLADIISSAATFDVTPGLLLDTRIAARSLALSGELKELLALFGLVPGHSSELQAMLEIEALLRKEFLLAPLERSIHAHFFRVNLRGVNVNAAEAAQAAQTAAVERQWVIASTVGMGLPDPRSPDSKIIQFILERTRIQLGSLSRKSAERALALHRTPSLDLIIGPRDQLRALDHTIACCDAISQARGPVRPLLVGGGCSTGRAAPNMSNGARLNIQGLRRDAVASVRVRRLIVPPEGRNFCAVDLSQIEARITAWLCGEARLMALFAKGDDVYRGVGERVAPGLPTRLSRVLGKQAVLGLGFGMGSAAFVDWVNLAAPQAEQSAIMGVYDQFHMMFPRIAEGRRELFASFAAAHAGRPAGACGVEFAPRDEGPEKTIVVKLPTGRPLFYRSVENTAGRYYGSSRLGAKSPGEHERLCPDGVMRRDVTAPRLIENIVQAIARDIVFHQIIELEEAGYPVAFSVHDEIVCLAPKCTCPQKFWGYHRDDRCCWLQCLQTMTAVMARVPSTLPGLRGLSLACQVRTEVRRTYA